MSAGEEFDPYDPRLEGDAETILMESRVGARDMAPAVVLRWGSESGELTPAAARMHALHVLETAEAAEHDAAMVRWLVADLHLSVEVAVASLLALRVHRGTA